MAGIGITVKKRIDHPERWRWIFSALPDACDECRELDGEEVEYASDRYKVLESREHGCERGKRCRCGCSFIMKPK